MAASAEAAQEEIIDIVERAVKRRSRRIASGRFETGKRIDTFTVGRRGRYIKYRPNPKGAEDIAIIPTIQRAAIRSRIVGEKVIVIDKKDICEKIRRRKRPALICIAFDTSSSMTIAGKAFAARKVLDEVLLDAYQKRDRISVVTFSGEEARTDLNFTGSVDKGRQVLRAAKFGGTTPLAEGLQRAFKVLVSKTKGEREAAPLLLLLTDGGANKLAGLDSDVERELKQVCNEIKEKRVSVVVIDASCGESQIPTRIAEWTGGAVYMPTEYRLTEQYLYPQEIEVVRRAISIAMVSRMMQSVLIRHLEPGAIQQAIAEMESFALEIEVVRDCPYGCDPRNTNTLCLECRLKAAKGELDSMLTRMPIVRLPMGISPGQMAGKQFVRNVVLGGVLPRANRGILVVDELSQVGDDMARLLVDVSRRGEVEINGPRWTTRYPCRFVLVGFLPEGKEVSSLLLSAFNLAVDGTVFYTRQHIMQRILYMREFEHDPEQFAKNLSRMAKEGMFAIMRARSMYQRTESPDHVLDFVARICNQFNVGGNYAEVMIEETARANATLKGRMRTEESDVIEAADLVLPLLAPKITRERAAELERIRRELVGSG